MQNGVIDITISALVGVALFLGAYTLSTHWRLAAALRVIGLLTVLTGLAIGVHTHGWVTSLDASTTAWFVAHRSAEFDSAARVITDFGSPSATLAAGLICGALLSWRARSVIPGVVVIGTVATAALAGIALKAVVLRPRTPLELRLLIGHLFPSDHSFPSGHVTGTAALLGTIAVCVGAGRSRTARAWLAASVVATVLIVAVTRLYLGVHWLTDVIGGAVLAGVFLVQGAAVIRASRPVRQGRAGASTSNAGVPLRQR